MYHLFSAVKLSIFGAVRHLKSSLPAALLLLLASSFAVTAQANVVYDFEGFAENLTDAGDHDGSYAMADSDFPAYGLNAGRGLVSVLQEDGVTSSAMLRFENGIGAPWWSGFTLASEYPGSDFIGDGSAPVTMTVLADQDGDVTLELESGATGEIKYSVNLPVIAGWNELSFDVSGADASIDWRRVQIRPDAADQEDNSEVRFYYFDDISFPNATIVAAPGDPTSAAFLAGPATPDENLDAVSLYSDVFPSALDDVGNAPWSLGTASDIPLGAGNEVMKLDQTVFIGFDVPGDVSIGGISTLSISLYRQASSNFEIKLVDLTPDVGGEMVYYVPAEDMTTDQWVTLDIPLSSFTGSVSNVDQIVMKPMGGVETFYMDDMYFHGIQMVDLALTLEVDSATANGFVFLNSDLWDWDDAQGPDAVDNGDGTWTATISVQADTSFQYQWYVDDAFENLSLIYDDGYCAVNSVSADYVYRVYDHTQPNENDIYNECDSPDRDGDGLPDAIDEDDDGDGVEDADDVNPLDPNFSSKAWDAPMFSEAFGGATITGSALDGDGPLYTFPTSTDEAVVEDYAGFANKYLAVYPLYFTEAGSITFTGSVPTGGSAVVRFRLEKNPFPDVAPFYNTETVTVSGATEASYTVNIPSQGANVYQSLLMYLDTRDVGVIVKDVVVTRDADSGGKGEPVPGNITFNVDMNGVDLGGQIPNLVGEFNGWCGQCAAMTDEDGDGVWSITLNENGPMDAGSYAYKFALGATYEALSADLPTSCISVTYGANDEVFVNRLLVVDGDADLAAVPFGGCASEDNSGGDTGGVPATPTGGVVMTFEDTSVALNPGYGGVTASYASILEVDGVTSRNMLKLENAAGSAWWSGVALALEYADSDFRGDGSALVTMRVYAEQDGDLMLQLESGTAQFDDKQSVVTGWNNVTFDLSGADSTLNWHNVQIRPDALSGENNVAATVYYIDDVHFADATIVAAPGDPTSAAFLAGAATPTATDVVSLFSDAYSSALNGVNITGWSTPNSSHSEMTIDNGNTIKKFEQAVFAGFDVPVDFSIDGKTTMSVSLYRQASFDFEIKLVDLTSGTVDMIYYIPAADMPVDQWSTIDVALSDFTGSVTNIDQLVIKPMGGAETFYMDDLYFHGTAVVVVDSDGDGVADADDAFPNDASETADSDNDGVGDNADAFPNDASETADSDNDGVGDNADVFPNDASETADSDNDGVGDNADFAPNDPAVQEGPKQSVSVSGTPNAMIDSPVSITVGYDVSDGDSSLTGLGLRVHYDSSVLTFVELSNVLSTDLIASGSVNNDTDNDDGDASTDKYVTASWASLYGNWPGALPADLLTATFNVVDDDSVESTVINFSASSNSAGYQFEATPYTLDIVSGSFDFDGNGTADALTDGLMMLRFAFGLTGDGVTNGAIADNSTMTSEEVLAALATAVDSKAADIDGNGNVDALTDGLMLLRALFGLSGDGVTAGAVGDGATRTSAADIEAYIDSMSP